MQRAPVSVGIDRHRRDAHLAAGANDAYSNLSPVGHKHFFEHGYAAHMRKTPNPPGVRGELSATDKARPKTWRVSAGSRTPSSHRRAVE